MTSKDAREFIPYQEFLEAYSINRSTGDRMRKDGTLKVYRLGGGKLLFVRASEIEGLFKVVPLEEEPEGAVAA